MADDSLTREEAEVFARGLYHLATLDGITPDEQRLLEEFVEETGLGTSISDLADPPFSPIEAAQVLETSFLRHLFLKTAVAMVHADGHYSDAERRALGEIADAFGISAADFAMIEQEGERASLT
ncbi:MAG: TerB family tellurite resistance protein [Deltaproteobacteria bacterium]|nr:MAG: TerB family tellurite resistance protein [Deltaproteobacteria bacterium]